jgi:hypothetical protein
MIYTLQGRADPRPALGDVTDVLANVSAPLPQFGNLSPLWIAVLGAIALIFVAKFGEKKIRQHRATVRKREERKQRIQSLQGEIRRLQLGG